MPSCAASHKLLLHARTSRAKEAAADERGQVPPPRVEGQVARAQRHGQPQGNAHHGHEAEHLVCVCVRVCMCVNVCVRECKACAAVGALAVPVRKCTGGGGTSSTIRQQPRFRAEAASAHTRAHTSAMRSHLEHGHPVTLQHRLCLQACAADVGACTCACIELLHSRWELLRCHTWLGARHALANPTHPERSHRVRYRRQGGQHLTTAPQPPACAQSSVCAGVLWVVCAGCKVMHARAGARRTTTLISL